MLYKATKQIESIAKEHPVCHRLMTAPGVGPIVAFRRSICKTLVTASTERGLWEVV